MSQGEIRVGIVGAGGNTTFRHIPGLQAIEGVKIVGVANRSRESGEKVARQFGIPRVHDRWQDLVASPEVDAIVIGTWPYLHHPVTLAALAAGKHVLTEARMAMDGGQAREMRDAARQHPELVAMVVPPPHVMRVERTVQRLLDEGYVGDLYAVEVRAGGTFLDPAAPLHWRQDVNLSGHNTMAIGIWYEIVMRWVGPANRIVALGQTFVKTRHDAGGHLRAVQIPDHLDVIAELACGAQVHFLVSNVAGLAGAPEVWLFGSAGTLRISQEQLFGGKRGDQGLAEIAIPPEEAYGWRVEQEFANAIRGVEPVTHSTFDDGVKYMDFTDAVVESIQTGRAVSLPLF